MSKKYIGSRGSVVDVDLLRMKHQMLEAKRDKNVTEREAYIDKKKRRVVRTPEQEDSISDMRAKLREQKLKNQAVEQDENIDEADHDEVVNSEIKSEVINKTKRIIKK